MTRRLALSIYLFLLVAGCFALSHASRAADDWLPIAPEDLALKDNPASPGADAMILYRESYTDAEGAYETEYLRVKIFTEKGKEQGDVKIEYLDSRSHIGDIRARTIRPDGSIANFDGKIYDKEIV